jgi:ABC-type branched-subunit amino acid transport system ATPase component
MDEPSMGLSPVYVEQVFEIIQTINRQGTTSLWSNRMPMALAIADRAYVLQTGQISTGTGTSMSSSGSHETLRWRGTDSKFRFPERSVNQTRKT